MWVPEVARGAVRFTGARVPGGCELLGVGILCDLSSGCVFSYMVLRENQEVSR